MRLAAAGRLQDVCHGAGHAMQVQLNTDRHFTGSDALSDRVSGDIEDALSRFDDRLTRVEVHINDVNGAKAGDRDIRCMLEARLKGLDPVAVTDQAESLDLALAGAIEKLATALDRRLGKLNSKPTPAPRGDETS
jgi:ribosome-associated translation inhibitor RaiA